MTVLLTEQLDVLAGAPGLVLASIMGVTGCLLLPAALVLAGVVATGGTCFTQLLKAGRPRLWIAVCVWAGRVLIRARRPVETSTDPTCLLGRIHRRLPGGMRP